MKTLRYAEYDKTKTMSELEADMGKTCTIDGCDSPLTLFKGPGQDVLCREHQLSMREYGGMGRLDRPHTFHRSYVCSECGYDSLNDPRLAGIKDEMVKRRVARVIMHGDHQIRQADGGDDSAENVRGICNVCHAIKTILNEDYKKGKAKVE